MAGATAHEQRPPRPPGRQLGDGDRDRGAHLQRARSGGVGAPETAVDGDFGERTALPRVRAVPLAHLSVEVGHLYMEDLTSHPDRLVTLLEESVPWVEAATKVAQARL